MRKQPGHVIFDALDASPGASYSAERILEDLREEGWHLVATPEIDEQDELVDGQRVAMRVVRIETQVDRALLDHQFQIHPMLIDHAKTPGVIAATRKKLSFELLRELGEKLGMEL